MLFTSIKSTNLVPARPVGYRIRASTHHWQGKLLDNTWASASLEYSDLRQIRNAFNYFVSEFVEMQDRQGPSQDLEISFPEHSYELITLTNEDRAYLDVVEEATSLGWAWEERFKFNLLTGEVIKSGVFPATLSSYEWSGRSMGSSVQFGHIPTEGESKASLLSRILATAEKAKKDFPDAVPYQNIWGNVEADAFKTSVIFGPRSY